MHAGRQPDVGAVGARAPAPGRVDDQVDLPGRNQVDRVRRALPHLRHHAGDGHALLTQGVGRPGRGDDGEAQIDEAAGGEDPAGLVAIVERHEHGALLREAVARGDLALGEGEAEGDVDAHHLAGGAHLRSQQRVDVGEAVERQHGLLHRHVPARHRGA